MLKYVITFVLVAMMFVSCSSYDIDIEKYRHDPKIVMQGYVSEDNLSVKLGQSWFVTDSGSGNSLPGAVLHLSVNDVDCGVVPVGKQGVYRLDRKFSVGDRVELRASCDGMREASAVSVIPSPPELNDISVSLEKDKDSGLSRFRFMVTFTDPVGTDDYYGVFLYVVNMNSPEGDYQVATYAFIDTGDEPLFKSELGLLEDWILDGKDYMDRFYFFNDKTIDGQTYTLNLSSVFQSSSYEFFDPSVEAPDPNDLNEKLTVSIVRLSEDYYKFLDTMSKVNMDDFGSAGIAEPMKLHSNVSGGLGIFGGYAVSSRDYYVRVRSQDIH